jgi:hypothetical protein
MERGAENTGDAMERTARETIRELVSMMD